MVAKGKYVPSMADLARETGVSIATVSRVIKGDSRISEATKLKVMEVAARLGYSPNLLVNGIRGAGTRIVGVSMGVDDYYTKVFNGIAAALWARGILPLVMTPLHPRIGEREIFDAFIERRVEGVIARPVVYAEIVDYLNVLKERGLPMVLIDCDIQGVDIPFSGTDDFEGGRLAAEHLVALGHKVIGHLPGYLISNTGRGRCEGFSTFISSCEGVLERRTRPTNFAPVDSVIEELLLSEPRPTAVFAANDNVAAGVYAVALRLGLRIPEDVSILGFGDLPASSRLRPTLSSFDQSPELVGSAAVELLFEEISSPRTGSAPRRTSLIKPKLIHRESTQCPSSK